MNIKTLKKNVLVASTSSMLLLPLLTTPVFAQTITLNPTRAALRQERQENRMTLQHANADREIDRRVTALNALIGRINALKHITADQKATLTSEVQTEITNLQQLKAKIDADTDEATLKADKQSIVTAYRVFVVYMPKIEIIAHADNILSIAEQIQAKNPSGDAATKVADAITQANNAINAVTGLEPAGYPGNKTTLESARTMLQTARQDLNTAWSEMKTSK